MQGPLQVILKSRARKGGIPGMRLERLCMAAISILCVPAVAVAGPSSGIITGKVTYTGTPAKPEPINMSKQPECAKLYPRPLMTEKVVTGPGNTLQNVVVYLSRKNIQHYREIDKFAAQADVGYVGGPQLGWSRSV